MSSAVQELEAFIYGYKIGTLVLHEQKIYFAYEEHFKREKLEISPLKLHTEKVDGLYSNNDAKIYQGLSGIFFDSLPDKFGDSFIDRYFESKGKNIREITLLDRLSFIGNRGMGAIEYRPKEEDSLKRFSDVLVAKEAHLSLQNMLTSNKEFYRVDELMEILYGASPLGGGRPKMLVTFNEQTKQIRTNDQTLHEGFKRAIIKFDEVYYENESIGLTKLEYLYMNMAKDCQIEVAKTFLLEEQGQHHLIVERFDRDSQDEKIHMATASALLHKEISVPKVMSYEELLSLTTKLCKSHESVEEMFRRMVFNTLLFNVDDHAKNFSFLMNKKGEWSLSPAYDLTYSYGMVKEHLTTLQGKSKAFELKDYLALAKRYLIKKSRAIEMVNEIVKVIKELPKRAKELKIEEEILDECIKNVMAQVEMISIDS